MRRIHRKLPDIEVDERHCIVRNLVVTGKLYIASDEKHRRQQCQQRNDERTGMPAQGPDKQKQVDDEKDDEEQSEDRHEPRLGGIDVHGQVAQDQDTGVHEHQCPDRKPEQEAS